MSSTNQTNKFSRFLRNNASLLLLVLFGVFMEIDDEKYLIHGLFCFFLFVMISIIFLAFVPYVRKKAIKFELERYDFDTSKEETLEIYDFSADDFSLKFDIFCEISTITKKSSIPIINLTNYLI